MISLLAIGLLLAAQSATGTGTATTSTPATTPATTDDPARAARIDALIAAFPPSPSKPEKFDDERLAKLEQANPGKTKVLRELLEEKRKCETRTRDHDVMTMLRATVARLSDAQIDRLTRFYKSERFKRLNQLSDRKEAGQTLTPDEQKELDAIEKDPDVQAFAAASKTQMNLFFRQKLEDFPGECERQLIHALTEKGLDDA